MEEDKTISSTVSDGISGVLYLFINNYIPMAGITVAFKKYNVRKGIWGSDWCGLNNFKFLFATSDAWTITRNTVLYNVAFILINMVVGIAFAIFISDAKTNGRRKYTRVQSCFRI